MSNPKVFVSYSHDSEAHKEWVLRLATELRNQGVDAVLDRWDLTPGQDVVAFMQHGISDADRVIMVCSQSYVAKAEAGVGGVGYERLIVTAEVSGNIDTKKFVPIVRNNSGTKKIPGFLGNRLYIDFDDDAKFTTLLEELVRDLHGLYKLEKPPLGVPDFVSPTLPSLAKVSQRVARSLDTEWFERQSKRADAGLAALGFTGSMEVRACIDSPLKASQRALLAAVETAEIRTFGWPIGVTLNDDKWSAKPYADGIAAEISISSSDGATGRSSYDLWSASTAADFYTKLSLFEDDRDSGAIFFNSRIVRIAESMMFLSGLFRSLGVPPDAMMAYRCTHKGLGGRTLKSAGPSRMIFPKVATDDVSSVDLYVRIDEIMTKLPRLVQEICAPMFMLFQFMEFGDGIYDDIVSRFVNGEAS